MTALIDVHSHFLTDGYVAAARAAGHRHPDGMTDWPTWSVDEHMRLMDDCDIGRALLSISSPGVHFGDDASARALSRQVNEHGSSIARDRPDRFGHFASLPLPDVDGALAELTHALDDLGSDGVAVMTNTHGVYLGDRRYEPLYAELDRRRAVVFVHPTSPPYAEEISLGRPRPMLEFVFDSTRAVSDLLFQGVLMRYPDIDWIITHGGGTLPLTVDRIELFRTMFLGSAEGPTTTEQVTRLWFDLAGTPFPHQIPATAATFGTHRLLYGSDYCWTPPSSVAAQVDSIDAAQGSEGRTWRALTTSNAQRLLAPGATDSERRQHP